MDAILLPIVPADFPALALLAWNRDPTRALSAEDAFNLYERNWRHVDIDTLTPAERDLIAALTRAFGGGHFLATR
ncbi:hypothetical protein [Aurantimonas sp. Leaf443]|uniref:hypothetical protein n=1 Tax=Aurantimonas sp. Leaf443 TaxID=1736378 RepID=UPI0006FABEAC|nr:hypothetical protein [Aurantimonas sp. Leaf443]KQT85338.1 aminopeptidase [Aurantimonas sp. Leaf443]